MKNFQRLLFLSLIFLPVLSSAQTWQNFTRPVITGYQVNSITTFGNNAAVASTSITDKQTNGIDIYNVQNKTWKRITEEGFSFNSSPGGWSQLQYDNSGNLWVATGTRGVGLLKYDGFDWKEIGFGDNRDTARDFRQIAIHPVTGHLWLISDVNIPIGQTTDNPPIVYMRRTSELIEYDGTNFKTVYSNDSNQYRRINFSTDGRYIWLLQYLKDKLLLKVDASSGSIIKTYPLEFTGVPSGIGPLGVLNEHRIVITPDDKVWFGYNVFDLSKGALNVFDPTTERWSHIDSNIVVTTLTYDGKGAIKYSGDASIIKRDFTTKAIIEILDINSILSAQYPILTELVESNGRTWIGTNLYGVSVSDEVVSVNEKNMDFNTLISPNPAKDYINIHASLPAGNISIRVHSLLGETVAEQFQHNDNEAFSLRLPIENIAPGVYFVTLKSGEKSVTQMFVKE